MGRAYQVEERREEEVAPEESQAFSRYRPQDDTIPAAYLVGMLVMAGFAGASLLGRALNNRRSQRLPVVAHATSHHRTRGGSNGAR